MCIVLYFGIVYSVLFYSVIMLLHGFVLDYVTLYHVISNKVCKDMLSVVMLGYDILYIHIHYTLSALYCFIL